MQNSSDRRVSCEPSGLTLRESLMEADRSGGEFPKFDPLRGGDFGPTVGPHGTEDDENWLPTTARKVEVKRVWSVNVSSWHSHGERLLELADANKVHAILV